MRQKYFDIVLQKTDFLLKRNEKVVVTQALIKESNRRQIFAALPEIRFIHVTAAVNNINQRLRIRDNWVSIEYANKIRTIFEEPEMSHINIDNNRDKQHIMNQLDALL
jgi:gluconate kinase